jgi:hypothetical protein
MVYMTPYLKGSSFLFAGGIIVYASYLTYDFVRDLKRIKKETARSRCCQQEK